MGFSDLIVMLPMLLFSVVIHEIAHGWVALKCGDPTARDAGRLTLNPIPHIDPFMTIILPIFLLFSRSPILFGGAKPVPVNPYNLRGGEKDNVKVSIAGAAANILLALGAAFLSFGLALLFRHSYSRFFASTINLLNLFIILNLILANFNLIPIPPLDGSHLLAYFLKGEAKQFYRRIQARGFMAFIVFLLLAQMIPVGSGNLFSLLLSPAFKLFYGIRAVQLYLMF